MGASRDRLLLRERLRLGLLLRLCRRRLWLRRLRLPDLESDLRLRSLSLLRSLLRLLEVDRSTDRLRPDLLSLLRPPLRRSLLLSLRSRRLLPDLCLDLPFSLCSFFERERSLCLLLERCSERERLSSCLSDS